MPCCLPLDRVPRAQNVSKEAAPSHCQIIALSIVALIGAAVVAGGYAGLFGAPSGTDFTAAMGAAAILAGVALIVLASHAVRSCSQSKKERVAATGPKNSKNSSTAPQSISSRQKVERLPKSPDLNDAKQERAKSPEPELTSPAAIAEPILLHKNAAIDLPLPEAAPDSKAPTEPAPIDTAHDTGAPAAEKPAPEATVEAPQPLESPSARASKPGMFQRTLTGLGSFLAAAASSLTPKGGDD